MKRGLKAEAQVCGYARKRVSWRAGQETPESGGRLLGDVGGLGLINALASGDPPLSTRVRSRLWFLLEAPGAPSEPYGNRL